MLITIENADKKLLDVIKSIIKLSPNANLKIEKEPTARISATSPCRQKMKLVMPRIICGVRKKECRCC